MFAVEFVTSRPVNAPAYYGLCAPGTYSLGRSSDCHLVLSSADISRHHITLRVVLRDQMHEVLTTEALQNLASAFDDDENEPFITPIVLVVENRSQFGCRVDNINLSQDGAMAAITSGGGNLHVGSITLRFSYRPVLVAVNTETFARDFSEEVSIMYQRLGAEILPNGPQPCHSSTWHHVDTVLKRTRRPSATRGPYLSDAAHRRSLDREPLAHVANFGAQPIAKFLVTNAIDASPHCLLALAYGYSLVHPSFVFEFFAALAENCKEPMARAPHPSKYEPQISRLVFPHGGYTRPEGRSLPFPLFPPTLTTPWYKSRHRIMSNCLVTFRSHEVAVALVECVAAMGGTVIRWEPTKIEGKKNLLAESGGDDEDDEQGSDGLMDTSDEDSDLEVGGDDLALGADALSNSRNTALSNSRNTGGGGTGTASPSEAGRQSTIRTKGQGRSRAWSVGRRPKGSRLSDVDSSTGEPLLLPHQIAKRQAAMKKKKEEMEAKMEELFENSKGRDETLQSRSFLQESSSATLAENRGGGGGKDGDSLRRRIVILSPVEVSDLTQSVFSSEDPSSAHHLHEDILAYARRGFDVIACDEILRCLLACSSIGPSLLDQLVQTNQPNLLTSNLLLGAQDQQQQQQPPPPQLQVDQPELPGVPLNSSSLAAAAASGGGSGMIRKEASNLSSHALGSGSGAGGVGSGTRLTEAALQTHQDVLSVHGSGNNLRGAQTEQGQGQLVEQFTEKEDSERTPSDLDEDADIGDIRPLSTAGTTIFGGSSGLQMKFDDSLSVTLRLDRTKSTVLSRLRRACERNVLSYRPRLMQLRKLRSKVEHDDTPLDIEKLSVVRDALQSCEHFLSSLEDAEKQLASAQAEREREREERRLAGDDGHSPWTDAVEPLRDAAVEVAKIAYNLLKRDQPSVVSAGDNNSYNFQQVAAATNNTPQKGRGGFSGMVQSWEQPKVKSGGVNAARKLTLNDQAELDELNSSSNLNRNNSGGVIAATAAAAGGGNSSGAGVTEAYENNPYSTTSNPDIHPLTNWLRYSPDIPASARDDHKPIVPSGIAVAPTMSTSRIAQAGGMKGTDLRGIANFRKSLMAQHGDKEGALRFELWLGSQSAEWTGKFHAELERRDLTFSQWLSMGQVQITQ